MVSIENGEIKTALSVGEIAERSGVAVSAIHFYEKKGLIDSWRNAGNQRRFHRGVLRRIAVIKVAQRLGIPLSEIGETLATLPAWHSVVGDRRNPGNPADRPHRDIPRLAAALRAMEVRSESPHRVTGRTSGSTHKLHRLRLPVH